MLTSVLNFEQLVLGGTLNAVRYSYQSATPLIINKIDPPLFFNEEESAEWNQKVFLLSLAGLLPVNSDQSTTRLVDENNIKIIINPTHSANIRFDKLIIFDDENVSGFPEPIETQKKKLVLDWIKPTSCAAHTLTSLHSKEDFVNEVIFYPKPKFVSQKGILVKSFLTDEQIQDFNYSSTYARMKVEKMMLTQGIRGRYNGQWIKNPEQALYYALHLDAVNREVKKNKMNLYQDTPTLKFKYSFEDNKIKTRTPSLEKLERHFF